MGPDRPKFGGGASETLLHPFVLVAMIITIVLLLLLPRRIAAFPLLFMTFLAPNTQQFYFAGIHLFVLRIVILAGLARVFSGKDPSETSRFAGGWNSIDTAFSICVLIEAVAVVLLNHDGQALVNQVGFVWDMLGGYLLLRYLVRDENDIYRVTKCMAILSLLLGIAMIIEWQTMENVFGLLGGVRSIPEIREGKVRSQAVFQHSLLAGTVGATLLPLFVLLWTNAKAKTFAVIGAIGSTTMMLTSNSSTPLLAYAAGIFAICFWPFRKVMRKIRYGIVAGLIALSLVMKAPVWFIIAHIDLTGSSSSYHRAALVDVFIRNFSDWWLIGTNNAENWGWDMWDVQNQYVSVGEAGGLAAFIFFIAVISRSFGRIGDARKIVDGNISQERFLWLLGAALFSNIVGYFGVNYFDQSRMAWFVILTAISAGTSGILKKPEDIASRGGIKGAKLPLKSQSSPPRHLNLNY